MLKGRLLALDGMDGAGKTTQARLLASALRHAGYRVTLTAEPTGGPLGQRLLAATFGDRLPLHDELRMCMGDRAEHARQVIGPALDAGDVVVVDRYYYTSAARLGARGAYWRDVVRQNESVAPRPDLVLLLDCDPSEAQKRVAGLQGEVDGLLARSVVRTVFRQMSRGDDLVSNVRVVDANRPRDEVHKEILRRVGDLAPSGRVVRSIFGKDLERPCDLAGHDGLEPLHNEGPAPPTMKAVSR